MVDNVLVIKQPDASRMVWLSPKKVTHITKLDCNRRNLCNLFSEILHTHHVCSDQFVIVCQDRKKLFTSLNFVFLFVRQTS